MDRRRLFRVLAAARQRGPYDEFPALRDGLDPQVHLSRNDRDQPFYLVCDHDTLLAPLAGEGVVHMKEASVLSFALEPGDLIYIPSGVPSRIEPTTELVTLRFKKLEPALEGVAWYCDACGDEVWRRDFSLDHQLPQEGYWESCRLFNESEARRRCGRCGAVRSEVNLADFQFLKVADEIRSSTSTRVQHQNSRV